MRRIIAPVLIAAIFLLQACLPDAGGDGDSPVQAQSGPATTAVNSGSGDWPEGLEGPFEMAEVLHVFAPMSDGITLEGWIGIPTLPAGVKAPTLVSVSPYYGYCALSALSGCGPPTSCTPTPDDEAWWDAENPLFDAVFPHWGVAPGKLVQDGYAVAFFSVRGTGNSGGCFDWYGERTRTDQAELVAWLAAQEWSSGRVGFGGLSLPSIAATQAAVQTPDALKAILIGGTMSDFYTFHMTPQGAQRTAIPACLSPIAVATTFGGFSRRDDPAGGAQGYFDVADERACADTPQHLGRDALNVVVEDRDEGWYAERRLAERFDEIDAAVLLAQGYFDGWRFEDDVIYQELKPSTPKRRMTGPWPHSFPVDGVTEMPAEWPQSDWVSTVTAWLDRYVKGLPVTVRHDVVDFQDLDGSWHSSAHWPPVEASNEVLYFHPGRLAPERSLESSSFISAPTIFNSPEGAEASGFPDRTHYPLCPWMGLDPGTGIALLGDPVDAPVTIAGNPHLWLRLSSSLPVGLITARVGRLQPDWACDALGQVSGYDSIDLHTGAADLRFHQGNFVAQPFPIATPTSVRVDLPDFSITLMRGDRLVVELSYGETHVEFTDRGPYPEITVHGGLDADASHIVLPVIKGTLGGEKAHLRYPPNPFAPR